MSTQFGSSQNILLIISVYSNIKSVRNAIFVSVQLVLHCYEILYDLTGFNDWDPMREDYNCKRFNSYGNFSNMNQEFDPRSLYIKNIPSTLTSDEFVKILRGSHRKVGSYKLFDPKPDMNVTIGMATFSTEDEAAEVLDTLNRQQPLNFIIQYANKKQKKMPQDANVKTSHQNPSRISGKGCGSFLENESLDSIKIVLDGDKRSCYPKVNHETNNIEGVPALVPNPFFLCLHCKQPGKLSCGLCQQPYCSQLCQKEDWPKHKTVCTKNSVVKVNKRPPNDSSYVSESNSGSDCDKTANLSNCRNNFKNSPLVSANNHAQLQPSKVHQASILAAARRKSSEQIVNSEKTRPVASPPNQNRGGAPFNAPRGVPMVPGRGIESPVKPRSEPLRPQFQSVQRTPPSGRGRPMETLARTEKAGTPVHPKVNICANEVAKTNLAQHDNVEVCLIINPNEFWVRLASASKILFEMENKMLSAVEKVSVKCNPGDMVCYVHNGVYKRVKVLEVRQNTSEVENVDHGGRELVKNVDLCFLPQEFKKYATQAVCCSLMDSTVDMQIRDWEEEDILYMKSLTTDKSFRIHVHKKEQDMYKVSLIDCDGTSVYSALSLYHQTSVNVPEGQSEVSSVPTVWSSLKQGSEVNFAGVQRVGDKFWGVLDDGSGLPEISAGIETLLKDLQTEDTSLTSEEGDVVAGFSSTYQQYYRCVVLKRNRASFLVHYIDFGNQEETTKLCSLTPALLEKKSFVVCCEKPPSISEADFETLFETAIILTVKTVNKASVELSCKHKNSDIIFKCLPWSSPAFTEVSNHTEVSRSFSKENPNRVSSNAVNAKYPSTTNVTPAANQQNASNNQNKIMKTDIKNKNLKIGKRYKVKISCIKSAQTPEVFVNLLEDDKELSTLAQQLNIYANDAISGKYVPKRDEVLCCKYSLDGVWYRGEAVQKCGNQYTIHFIDYGNQDVVLESDLKPLPAQFAVPKLGCFVSLECIKQEDITPTVADKLTQNEWFLEVSDVKQPPFKGALYNLNGKSLTDLLSNKFKHYRTALKYQKLPTGQVTEAKICFLTPENLLCLQQSKDVKRLSDLQEKINSAEKVPLPKQPEIDMICSCLSSDGSWYRACIREIASQSCKVSFIDYGNEEEVNQKDLKKLPDELFSCPVLCIQVFAQNLEVAASVEEDGRVKVEVIGEEKGTQKVKLLIDAVKGPTLSSLKKCSLVEGKNEVVFCHNENETFYCHLTRHAPELQKMYALLLNPELKALPRAPSAGDLVLAKCSDGSWYRGSVELPKESRILFIDFGNVEVVQSDNIKCLPKGLEEFPIFCIPVKISNINKVKHRMNFTSTFTIVAPKSLSCDINVVEIDLPQLPKRSSLTKQTVTPGKELCVGVCHKEGDLYYTFLSDSKDLSQSLVTKLEAASQFQSLEALPDKDDLVCAKFDEDGNWYRGSVEEVYESSCKILFLDFGNFALVSLENLRMLSSDVCSFPLLAIPTKFKNADLLSEQTGEFLVKVVETVGDVCVFEIVSPEAEAVFPIEPQILPLLPVDVRISHAADALFYVQKVSDTDALLEMYSELQNGKSSRSLSHKPKLGELVSVKYMDEFSRGVVTKVCGENKFEIFFVDYGNTEVADLNSMCEIPPKYSSTPMLSILVKFAEGTKNLDAMKRDDEITIRYTGESDGPAQIVEKCSPPPSQTPVDVKRYMRSNLATRELPLDELKNVTFYHQDKDVMYLQDADDKAIITGIQLTVKTLEKKQISHQLLVGELVCAQSAQDDVWYRGCIELISEDNFQVNFIDYGNSEVLPISRLGLFADTLYQFPVLCSAVKIIGHEPTVRLPIQLEKLYSVVAGTKFENGAQLVKVVMQHNLHSSVAVAEPNRVPAKMSNAKPRKYYHDCAKLSISSGKQDIVIYSVDDVGNVFWAPFDTENISANFDLLRQITEHCESTPNSSYSKDDPPEHTEIVLAKFSDGSWYRGCVAEEIADDEPKDLCSVFFIDFGNMEDVSINNIRPMESKFMSLPIQAVQSQISGFNMDEDKLPLIVEEMRTFTIAAYGNPLQADVDADEDVIVINQITTHLVGKQYVTSSK